MVNKNDTDKVQDDLEITNDTDTTETHDPELYEIENDEDNKLKTLKTKLKESEEKNRNLLEELQRSKADFLNGKRRLEEDRIRDKARLTISHVEKLLPLCDSFYLAMLDKETWAKADEKWRKGVEGILSQLNSVLSGYKVTSFDPTGLEFDHNRHEALAQVPVTDETQNNKVLSVIQQGYEIDVDGNKELIRPARVTVGEYTS
ncbi:nucleotide exchange factor GrpE [Patescibacteria group bacterium]|nr:nucleotide exchange factor GrpE [Patescibacteria group bacterium]